MSKNKTHTIEEKVASCFILAGLITAIISTQLHLKAQLITGQEAKELAWTTQETVLAAAPIQQQSSTGVLAFGMLMMLIGIGMHAWYTMQHQEKGRPVPVHIRKQALKRPEAKKSPRKSRRQAEVIWVERTIRF